MIVAKLLKIGTELLYLSQMMSHEGILVRKSQRKQFAPKRKRVCFDHTISDIDDTCNDSEEEDEMFHILNAARVNVSADNPNGTADNPEGTGDNADGTADNPDVTADNPVGTQDNPNGTGHNLDGTHDNPDGTGHNLDGIGDNPDGTNADVTADKSDGTADNPDGTAEKNDIVGSAAVTSRKPRQTRCDKGQPRTLTYRVSQARRRLETALQKLKDTRGPIEDKNAEIDMLKQVLIKSTKANPKKDGKSQIAVFNDIRKIITTLDSEHLRCETFREIKSISGESLRREFSRFLRMCADDIDSSNNPEIFELEKIANRKKKEFQDLVAELQKADNLLLSSPI